MLAARWLCARTFQICSNPEPSARNERRQSLTCFHRAAWIGREGCQRGVEFKETCDSGGWTRSVPLRNNAGNWPFSTLKYCSVPALVFYHHYNNNNNDLHGKKLRTKKQVNDVFAWTNYLGFGFFINQLLSLSLQLSAPGLVLFVRTNGHDCYEETQLPTCERDFPIT